MYSPNSANSPYSPCSADTLRLVNEARVLLKQNDAGSFTKPSNGQYPHQWNWDSAAIAIGLAHHNADRALGEIASLLKGQWTNGMVPHIVFHDSSGTYFPDAGFWQTDGHHDHPHIATSGISQPPVLATALRQIVERHDALDFVRQWYPALVASHRWFHVTRSIDDSCLTTTVHPWESGTDDSPRWLDVMGRIVPSDLPTYIRVDQNHVDANERPNDADYERYVYLVDHQRRLDWNQEAILQLSPFCVQDVLTNSVLLRADDDLIWLGEKIGADTSEIAGYRDRAKAAFTERFWDDEEGLFFDFDVRMKSSIRVNTAMTFLPLWAGLASPHQAAQLLRHLQNPAEYWFEPGEGYLVSTTSRTEPAWSPVQYWRGPVWVLMNWFLHGGLIRYGETALADRVHHDTVQLVEKGGYAEYFNPFNADPCGITEFSWSASLLMDLLLR
jgi:glycogen debranching enzyme